MGKALGVMGQRTGKAARPHSVVDGGEEAWGAWEADWVTDVQQQMKPAERDQLQGGLEAGEAIAGKARAATADRGGGMLWICSVATDGG